MRLDYMFNELRTNSNLRIYRKNYIVQKMSFMGTETFYKAFIKSISIMLYKTIKKDGCSDQMILLVIITEYEL